MELGACRFKGCVASELKRAARDWIFWDTSTRGQLVTLQPRSWHIFPLTNVMSVPRVQTVSPSFVRLLPSHRNQTNVAVVMLQLPGDFDIR